ncbi:MAG: co-chaperone GroES [Bdellovibrionales bacterium]|nr:co-chaperone GroES [Bdellovibrionales bacterium]
MSKKSIKKAASKKPIPKKGKASISVKSVKKLSQKTATKVIVDIEGLFTPLDDRLIVRFEAPSETTAGGIIIPSSVSGDRPDRGEVIAVGRGHRDNKGRIKPMDVQMGDQVLFSTYAGQKITMASADVYILRESDILGIID